MSSSTKFAGTYVYHLAIAAGLVHSDGTVMMTAPVAHFLAAVAMGEPVDVNSGEAWWASSWNHLTSVDGRIVLAKHFDGALAKIAADIEAVSAAA